MQKTYTQTGRNTNIQTRNEEINRKDNHTIETYALSYAHTASPSSRQTYTKAYIHTHIQPGADIQTNWQYIHTETHTYGAGTYIVFQKYMHAYIKTT